MEAEQSSTDDTVLRVRFPRWTLLDLGLSESRAAEEMLRLFVVELFRSQRISSGKAAEILGMSKYSFIQLLARYKEDYFQYLPTELEEELDQLEGWERAQ